MSSGDSGRRDRTGEIEVPHDPECTGWLGEDHNGSPRPCLVCKPHLRPAERYRRTPGRHRR